MLRCIFMLKIVFIFFIFFFFQAEDGIRDYKVTGVQTCALPIYSFGLIHWPGGPWAERRAPSSQFLFLAEHEQAVSLFWLSLRVDPAEQFEQRHGAELHHFREPGSPQTLQQLKRQSAPETHAVLGRDHLIPDL